MWVNLMVATGHIECSHSTTKGAVICQECNTNVTVYPWQLKNIRQEEFKEGLKANASQAMQAFKCGLVFGTVLTIVITYCVFLMI